MTKLTARTKAALAILPTLSGHDTVELAIQQAFYMVDMAVAFDANVPSITEEEKRCLNGFDQILTALQAADTTSALRVIEQLKGKASAHLQNEQARTESSFNERSAKLAILQLEGRIPCLQATIEQQGWDLEHARRRIEELEGFAKRFFDWGDALVFDDEADPLIQLIDEAGKLTIDGPKGQPAQEDNPDEIL